MSQPRPVPGIAHQRHTFEPNNQGRIQSPLSQLHPQLQQPPQAMNPSPQAQIAEQMHEMAATIYCELATQHIDSGVPVDPGLLRQLAADAQTAAKAYFEAMGVQFDG